MINIKIFTIGLFCTFFFISCQREIEIPNVDMIPCVGPEDNQDTLSGFLIFEKGKQEFGFAKGTKINKSFESSVYLHVFGDSVFKVTMVGYWPEYKGHSAEAERFGINNIPLDMEHSCYNLSSYKNSKDSIHTSYIIINDDVGILLYKLDNSADNKLEIISFDKDTKKFIARVKASFIGEKEYLPDLPKNVRFIDTYIEYGF